jgi:hypothetical protein
MRNSGFAELVLNGYPDKVMISGTNPADFIVTEQPVSPVFQGAGITFKIQFWSGNTGCGPPSSVSLIATAMKAHVSFLSRDRQRACGSTRWRGCLSCDTLDCSSRRYDFGGRFADSIRLFHGLEKITDMVK